MSAKVASTALVAMRAAVAEALADITSPSVVLVACSGGPDSLALAAVTAWVGARRGFRIEAIVVDHGLQVGSHEVAERAAQTCGRLGVQATRVVAVTVGTEGGPEAAARTARYAALQAAAQDLDASAVLLGHTREDQAETVLLRLARGSGARSLSAMRPRNGLWRRPLLAISREDVHSVAAEVLAPLGADVWLDPHNADPAYARVRVRDLLDDLRAAAGPGAVLGLTRSADLLRDDADALDAWAEAESRRLVAEGIHEASLDCAELLELPRAIRTRVIRDACTSAGVPPDAMAFDHVARVEALVSQWHGQGEIRLPGGVVALRSYGRLCLRSP